MKSKLVSYSSSKVSKILFKKILKLKNNYWRHSLKSQKIWFKKNIKKKDIHNCLFINENLIGYTCLRKRKYYIFNKKFNYLLFDTLIIHNKFRKKGFGNSIMRLNNKVINKKKLPSFLITTRKNVPFYKKNNWKICTFNFAFKNHKIKKSKILMSFNFKKGKIDRYKNLGFIYET